MQHLIGEDDVLVHAQRHARHGVGDVVRIGQGAQEVAADAVQQVELAARGRLDHLGRGEAGRVGHGEAVLERTARRAVSAVIGSPPGKAVA